MAIPTAGSSCTRAKQLIGRHPHTAAVLLLALATFALYAKVMGHDFILNWDDGVYIVTNPDIRGITPDHLRRILTTSYMANYAPVHLFSYMLDHALWGLKPGVILLENAALHLGCVLLFYGILIRFGLTVPQALCAALLFALHPVQVESVAWASQRKNPLSLLFFLAAWHAWLSWRDLSGGHGRPRWYFVSLACFTLALLAKSVAVVLPLFFLAQEWLPERRRPDRRFLLALLPYLALAALCFGVALLTQQNGGRIAHYGGSLGLTMMNMLPVFSRYLIELVWPAGLAAIYNAPIRTAPDATVILSALALLLFLAGWLRLRTHHRQHFFWLSLFLIALVPVANIIPLVTMMNDRYLYYPLLGMAPFAVLSLTSTVRALQARFRTVPVVVGIAVVIGGYGLVSWQRLDAWQGLMPFWQDTLAKAENGAWYGTNANFITYMYADALVIRARELERGGDLRGARGQYYLALAYDPGFYNALTELSVLYLQRDQPRPAIPLLERLTASYARSDEGHYLLGIARAMTGDLDAATGELRRTLQLNPGHTLAARQLRLLEESRSRHTPRP